MTGGIDFLTRDCLSGLCKSDEAQFLFQEEKIATLFVNLAFLILPNTESTRDIVRVNYARNKQYHNIDMLKNAIVTVSLIIIDAIVFSKLRRNMKNRLFQVTNHSGKRTDYYIFYVTTFHTVYFMLFDVFYNFAIRQNISLITTHFSKTH